MLCWSSHVEIPHAQGKRNPSKTVGVTRGHQRADTLKPYSQKTSQSNHTRTTALSNSMKLSHACGATQDRRVMMERPDRMWSTGEGNGKPLQYSCLENPMDSMKRQKHMALKDELQSYRRKHFCCLKPQGLWSLVRVASEVTTMSSPCTRNGPESATSAGALLLLA